MISSTSGKNILAYDGTNISRRGFWLLVNDKEFFISYSQYPEFLEMNLNQIFNVQSIDLIQFRWPDKDKDIDIDIESLETPESFPLHFKDNIN